MMIKRKWIFGMLGGLAILWGAILLVGKWIEHGLNRRPFPLVPIAHEMNRPDDPAVLWDAPAFSFPDQDGKTFTSQDLLGHVCIADFIFTQCTSACPVMTSKMMLLQKQLPMPSLRFVSFSVDPAHDSPAALKTYAGVWEGDQSRWRLLSTNPTGLDAEVRGMKVTVEASSDATNPILHSNLFFLIDTQGRVRGIYDSGDYDAMQRLADDARSLTGNESVVSSQIALLDPSSVERGRVMFGSWGCLGCHSRPSVAPPLQSVFGGMVRLDDHKMVWADQAYLHESIVDPGAKVVSGYTRSMPSYKDYLNEQQTLDLVNYIESLSSNPPGGHGLVAGAPATQPDEDELLTDPVCKMKVRRDSSSPHAVFDGKTYYFCSDNCREKFQKKPQDYTLTGSVKINDKASSSGKNP